MNGLYEILLFLFILGAVSQGANELGITQVHVPSQGVKLDTSTVTEVQSGAVGTSIDSFNTIAIVLSFMRIIGAGIIALFTIIPMLVGFMTLVGVDVATATIMAAIVQLPVTFVTLFGVYEWWTGRSTT